MSASWLRDAVFYEIYPQSFRDSNGDGIGDLPGITEKLPYVKSLGCNALWINPCFDSPFKDAGYDVRDYKKIAPRYGTNEDMAQLCRRAHALGIRVLLDLVPGHTSEEHEWFRKSGEAEPNEYSGRYIWTDHAFAGGDGMPFIGGEYPRSATYIINFFKCQPALNYGYRERRERWQQSITSPDALATREAMKDVIRFWLDLGCDGFRVDMAASLVKNDPDSLGTIALWQKVRAFLDAEFPEAAMVSEWGEPEKSLRGGFHMDFLLHFGPSHYNDLFRCEEPYFSDRGVGDASAFVEKYLESRERAGKDGLICIPSGNHDMTRLAKHVEGDEKKLAFAFLLTMPGAPFIYYGDEIGMRYVEGLTSVEGGYERTGARSPMQWDNGVNAGFSSAPTDKIYIRQDPASDRPTVAGQLDDGESLLNHVRRLIELRQAHSALQSRGGITFVSDGAPKRPLVYKRGNDEETLLVAINPYREEVSFRLDGTLGGALYTFGGGAVQKGETVTLLPVSAGVYGLK